MPAPFTTSKVLEIPGIRHGFFGREGGRSSGDLASNTMSITQGDNPDLVVTVDCGAQAFDAIAEGAVFDWGWSIRPGTPDIAESWWTLCLADWVASGCHVGGRSATGHGRVRLEDRIVDDLARVAKPGLEACTAWHEQHRTEILSWLTRL